MSSNVKVDKDELYQDILDGMAEYERSPFIADILRTVAKYPVTELGNALNRNQIRSKLWLADNLSDVTGGMLGTVYVLGGWYGVLGAILLSDSRFDIDRLVSVDIDTRCQPIAELLNRRHIESHRFQAQTEDMLQLDLRDTVDAERRVVVVNTSCEHMADFVGWYDRLPTGALMVLQSNDYYACPEHVSCVPDLAAFTQLAPMREALYAGTLPLKKYSRFMLIGWK